ncbi:MAG: pentapeptide repeat-containing protein [Calditrichaeota bacterium]|nr:pentapeptide repeat-containing protein [Calditrichota bacterium]
MNKNNLIQCSHAGCRLPAVEGSETCWEHLDNKEQFRRDLVENVADGHEYTEGVFIGVDLSGLDLTGMIASGANFTGSDLSSCKFTQAYLQKATLNRCLINLTAFDQADLSYAQLNNCDGSIKANNTNFKGSSARNTSIIEGDLSYAILTGADWRGARLINCLLNNINAQHWFAPWSDFTESELNLADFEFAVFGGSIMEHITAEHSNFKRANLIGVSAQNAIFNRADFYYARLTSGIFDNAEFVDANMTRAVLRAASFIDAGMAGSKIRHAVLDRARFMSYRPKAEVENDN